MICTFQEGEISWTTSGPEERGYGSRRNLVWDGIERPGMMIFVFSYNSAHLLYRSGLRQPEGLLQWGFSCPWFMSPLGPVKPCSEVNECIPYACIPYLSVLIDAKQGSRFGAGYNGCSCILGARVHCRHERLPSSASFIAIVSWGCAPTGKTSLEVRDVWSVLGPYVPYEGCSHFSGGRRQDVRLTSVMVLSGLASLIVPQRCFPGLNWVWAWFAIGSKISLLYELSWDREMFQETSQLWPFFSHCCMISAIAECLLFLHPAVYRLQVWKPSRCTAKPIPSSVGFSRSLWPWHVKIWWTTSSFFRTHRISVTLEYLGNWLKQSELFLISFGNLIHFQKGRERANMVATF